MYRLRHVARELLANAAMGIPAVRAIRVKLRRTTDNDPNVQADQLRREFDIFARQLDFSGKTIVEIGPGDTLGLGGLFLNAGAAKYIAIDRFLGDVFGSYAMSVYAALDVNVDRLRSLTTIHRTPIEEAAQSINADVVVSFNVVEHLVDPHKALRSMAEMLAPNGVMVHRVDYSAHNVWRTYSNGFAFLTIPDFLWHMMGSNRGCENRVRHSEIVDTLKHLGFEVRDRVATRHRLADLEAARHELLPRFRRHSDEDLLVLLADVFAYRPAP